MHLTSHITHSNGYAPYIVYYRSNGFDQRFRKLKPKPKLNPPNAHRSQIKICEKWHMHHVQFRFMPNAFRILKPIQKSSKRVWLFRNTGANAFAKNQMRLAYEDKRDLYCMSSMLFIWNNCNTNTFSQKWYSFSRNKMSVSTSCVLVVWPCMKHFPGALCIPGVCVKTSKQQVFREYQILQSPRHDVLFINSWHQKV